MRAINGTLVIVTVLVAAAVVMSTDLGGGPTREVEGVVKGTAAVPSQGPTTQLATVLLADGSQVTATVQSSALVHPGQTVRVREYRRIITAGKTYEILPGNNRK